MALGATAISVQRDRWGGIAVFVEPFSLPWVRHGVAFWRVGTAATPL
jgi:hypothetical protein